MKYQFIGQSERTYPNIVIDGRVLVAQPGERREFDRPPSDGLWVGVTVPAKPAKPAKENQA